MSNNLVITIARQYGSGGREIGEKVAEALGIKTYDRELITMAAQNSGLHEDILERADETATNSLLYTLAMGSNAFGVAGHFGYHMPINDKLFVLQSDVIREAVENEPCVIVGRAANYVLRDNPKLLSVFVYADLAERKRRVMERHDVSEGKALDVINKTDRRRSSYYNYYTGNKWGKLTEYDLAINSSLLGIDGSAAVIVECAKKLMEK